MKKTINKIFGLFSFGLLLFAADISYAQAIGGVNFSDAWEFIEQNTSDSGAQFKKDFGKKSDLKSTKVTCGKRLCNIKNNVCMKKDREGRDSDYICVKRGDAARYESVGYKVIAGETNPSSEDKELGEKCYKVKRTGTTNADMQATVYCAEIVGDRVDISVGVGKKGLCDVIEVSWYNSRKCTFCSMIGVIYGVADKIAVVAHVNLARSFAIVIAVGLMVWLAIKTLTFVSDVSQQDANKYITELITQSFKFLLAFFALLYYKQAFEMVILPLIRAGMTFGSSFASVETLFSRFGESVFSAIMNASINGDASALMGSDEIPIDYTRNASNKFFDLYTYTTMENLAYNVNVQYSLLQAIGRSLMCTGLKIASGAITNEGSFGLGLACIVYGLAFGVFGFLLSLAFVFYLLDAVVQIGIFAGLLPFLIACWPFEITKKYTKTGFDMLINSILVFVMMGAVASLSLELIRAAVEYNAGGGAQAEDQNGFTQLVKALSELDTVKLNILVNILSLGFILFIVANMMSMLFLGKVSDFAGKFASGAIPSIAPEIAGHAADTAKKAGGKAVGAVAEGAKDQFMKTTKNLRDDAKEKVRTAVKTVAKAVTYPARYVGKKIGQGAENVAKSVKNKAKQFGTSVKDATRDKLNQTSGGRKILNGYDKYQNARNERLRKEEEGDFSKHSNRESIDNILGQSNSDAGETASPKTTLDSQANSDAGKTASPEAPKSSQDANLTKPLSHDAVKEVLASGRDSHAEGLLVGCLRCEDITDDERKELEKLAVNCFAGPGKLEAKSDLIDEYDKTDTKIRAEGGKGGFKDRFIADSEYLLEVIGKNPENGEIVKNARQMLDGKKRH